MKKAHRGIERLTPSITKFWTNMDYLIKCKTCGKEETIKGSALKHRQDPFELICRSCLAKSKAFAHIAIELTEPPLKPTFSQKYKFTCQKCGIEVIKKGNRFQKNNQLLCKVCIRKDTNLKLFGVENPFQDKEKVKQGCIKKLGVENPSHLPSVLKKRIKKYTYKGECFDSSWELAFWIYNTDLHIPIQRNKDRKFSYIKNDKEHFFIPDFLVNDNDLVEIKGKHLMAEEYSDVANWQHKKDLCHQYNIKVISRQEINFYLKYVEDKYGKNYLKSLTKDPYIFNEDNTYIFISCSKKKQKYSCPAKEMYSRSEYFVNRLNYAKSLTSENNIFLISGKYGLLRLTDVVEPYDEKLSRKGWIKNEWQRSLMQQFRDLNSKKEIFYLGGSHYFALFPKTYFKKIIPYEGYGLGIGQQNQLLKKLLSNQNQSLD